MLIPSVTGPIDTANLGRTLMHEHIIGVSRSLAYVFPDWLDVDAELGKFKKCVEHLKPYGLTTLVDGSTIGNGRDIFSTKRAAEMTGINILVCTGLYWTEFPWFRYYDDTQFQTIDEDFLANLYIRELTQGIQGTDIKAAYVKCATDLFHGFSPTNVAMIRSCGKAALATGASVFCHSNSHARQGLEQQRILTEEIGVPPHRVYLGHAFTSGDMEYVEELIKKGSYVGCDQLGFAMLCPLATVAKNLAKIIHKDKTYIDHIVLSHDSAMRSDFALALNPKGRTSENPVVGDYHEVFEVLPRLLEKEGVGQEELDKMLIDNPRRFFEGRPFES